MYLNKVKLLWYYMSYINNQCLTSIFSFCKCLYKFQSMDIQPFTILQAHTTSTRLLTLLGSFKRSGMPKINRHKWLLIIVGISTGLTHFFSHLLWRKRGVSRQMYLMCLFKLKVIHDVPAWFDGYEMNTAGWKRRNRDR